MKGRVDTDKKVSFSLSENSLLISAESEYTVVYIQMYTDQRQCIYKICESRELTFTILMNQVCLV